MEERNALVFAQESVWITTLYSAFQDNENLYLIMEYVSGGSLRALLNNRETIMEESEARFYMAEMVLALNALHMYNYMHRDIKPENYLIDSKGHIKLADFGSCIGIAEAAKITSHETVGTPDYISPEVLRALEGGTSYGLSVDLWSIGVILYEILCDEVPFYAESLTETYGKIMDHEKYLKYPPDIKMTDDCKNLISKLICSQENRLKTAKEVMGHSWFQGVDFENIRNTPAPFIPQLSGPEDTRYFEDEDNESKKVVKKPLARTKEFSGQSLPFIGYTYVKDATALVSWNRGAISGGSSLAEAAPVAKDNAGDEKLKKVLEQLQKKLGLVEKENDGLKSTISKDNQARSKTENAIASLEIEKSKIESELSDARQARDEEAHKRVELEEKLAALKKSVDSFSSNRANTQELNEIKAHLEGEITKLTSDLRTEREQAVRKDQKIEELNRNLEQLAVQCKTLSQTIENGVSDKAKLETTFLEAKQELNLNIQAQEKQNEKMEQLIASLKSKSAELDSQKQILAGKAGEIDNLTKQLNDSNKKRAVLEVELASVKTLMSHMEHDQEILTKQLTDIQASQQQTNSSDIDSLKSQLEAHATSRQKMSNDYNSLNKEKMLLELEVSDLKSLHSAEKNSHDQTVYQIETLQATIDILEKTKTELVQTKASNEKIINQLNESLLSKEKLLIIAQENAMRLETKLSTFENEILNLNNQIKETHLQYEMESHKTELLDSKIENLQSLYSKELKARISFESASQDAEESNAQLIQEMERLRFRLDNVTKERDDRISEFKALSQNVASLQRKYANEEAVRMELDEINATISQEIFVLRQQKLENEEAYILSQEKCMEFEAQVAEFKQMASKERLRAAEMEARASEFESLYGSMKLKFEAIEPKDRDDKSIVAPEKKFRLRSMFFGNKKESESDNHGRMQSERSIESLASGFSTSSPNILKSPIEGKVTMFDSFSAEEGLSGWLKVPKGGKVKKGWRLQFAIVRDFKIYLYEDETEREGTNGAIVIDLNTEIYRVTTVSQNELIHASSNDIDSIFKIQAANPSSDSSKDKDNAAKERKAEILKLQTSIALEEKMLQATEKILNVTTDAQKIAAIGQLDACQKRLRALKSELEKLQVNTKRSTMLLIGGTSADIALEESKIQEADLRHELEEQLVDETKKRAALTKAATGEKRKSRDLLNLNSNSQAKDLDAEILSTDRIIAKIKEGLEVLNSGDSKKIGGLLQRYSEAKNKLDSKGHFFSTKKFFKHMDCGICHESLWDTKNEGQECACNLF